MAYSVEIYVDGPGTVWELTAGVAAAVGADECSLGRAGGVFTVDAAPIINESARASFSIELTDFAETGDSYLLEGMVIENFEYRMYVEFPSSRLRTQEFMDELGEKLFRYLSVLGYPMYYVLEGEDVRSAFDPGRGIVHFNPPVDIHAAVLEGEGGFWERGNKRAPDPQGPLHGRVCSYNEKVYFESVDKQGALKPIFVSWRSRLNAPDFASFLYSVLSWPRRFTGEGISSSSTSNVFALEGVDHCTVRAVSVDVVESNIVFRRLGVQADGLSGDVNFHGSGGGVIRSLDDPGVGEYLDQMLFA